MRALSVMPALNVLRLRPRAVAAAVIAVLALVDVSLLIAREAPSMP